MYYKTVSDDSELTRIHIKTRTFCLWLLPDRD